MSNVLVDKQWTANSSGTQMGSRVRELCSQKNKLFFIRGWDGKQMFVVNTFSGVLAGNSSFLR